uniref:KH type-2 domain-containing protein n=1 Tax=Peromyscus maniculatus bairdii TaxID=230844 RepID=A0A8C8U6K0_PERMB
MEVQTSKKRKFVAGLAEDGYSGVEVQVTPARTEIIISATKTQSVLGEKGRLVRELTAVVQKRFGFPMSSVELYKEKVATRGLCAIACVRIMLPSDPSGKTDPKKTLPDHVSIVDPKHEILPTAPISEQKGEKPEPPAMRHPVTAA